MSTNPSTQEDMETFARILETLERAQNMLAKLHDYLIILNFDNKQNVKTYHKAFDDTAEGIKALSNAIYYYGGLDTKL